MKKLVRMICLMLMLALLPLPAAAEDSAPSIRVLLRRLELTDRADLILDGVYTAAVNGDTVMAFPRGSQVVVQIREGQLYLFYEGMSLKLGSGVRFIRNASDTQQSDGLRFAKDGNFYPGDLSLTISGGALRPVLTLSVEDYLLGVVPYEMSNSFPLEALKAQAVCARTYALAHVDKSSDYDVVDTTNDQVFKGVDLTDTNAIRAVRETAGVVGAYKGKLANCYYSASNGGQTELVQNVWSGGGDWGYYAMTDDPYDLENPESVVLKARLPKEGSQSAALTEVLAEAIGSRMAKEGFGSGSDCLRIDSITDVKLGSPKHGKNSKLMTQLTLTFTWSGRNQLSSAPLPTTEDTEISLFSTPSPVPVITPAPAGATEQPTPQPTATPTPKPVYSPFRKVKEPATVTLDIFPNLIRALDLSVYGADNEILTVKETDTHFVLESRRYGHGVGMSQRGAQWMAFRYGKNFREILSFYYPGMELRQVAAGEAILPTAQPQLANSPEPPATPTPRPTLMPVSTDNLPAGAYLASVEGIADNSSLNLRQEPNTASPVLMRLYRHQQLIVLESCEDPAWVRVKTDVAEGYVMASFLAPAE
ncbi:MAG: SpoIID/LytB domain-containing protein [Clostridia bacterium]|nr:SpoIID/LytB domain-containing protein [Clostridia bacterium]